MVCNGLLDLQMRIYFDGGVELSREKIGWTFGFESKFGYM